MKAILCSADLTNESITSNTFTTVPSKNNGLAIATATSFQSQYSKSIDLKYTLSALDQSRLNKDGVLRVYNMDELIEIPVVRLLGKWQLSHVGAIFSRVDGQWQVTENNLESHVQKNKMIRRALKDRVLRFVPVNLFHKVLAGRLGENSLVKNA